MKCLYCHEEIKGRSDKRFCNAGCKSAYHNSRVNPAEQEIKVVNSILRKNRSILRLCSPQGKTTVRKEFLVQQEFNFSYFTQTFTTSNQNTYFLCYDYGYLLLPDDKVLIIKKQAYMK